jgi:hypothetical protein
LGDGKPVNEATNPPAIISDYATNDYEINRSAVISSNQIRRQQSHVKREVIRQDYVPLSHV